MPALQCFGEALQCLLFVAYESIVSGKPRVRVGLISAELAGLIKFREGFFMSSLEQISPRKVVVRRGEVWIHLECFAVFLDGLFILTGSDVREPQIVRDVEREWIQLLGAFPLNDCFGMPS